MTETWVVEYADQRCDRVQALESGLTHFDEFAEPFNLSARICDIIFNLLHAVFDSLYRVACLCA